MRLHLLQELDREQPVAIRERGERRAERRSKTIRFGVHRCIDEPSPSVVGGQIDVDVAVEAFQLPDHGGDRSGPPDDLLRAVGAHEQDGLSFEPANQVKQQGGRVVVRPLQVVEHDHQRVRVRRGGEKTRDHVEHLPPIHEALGCTVGARVHSPGFAMCAL